MKIRKFLLRRILTPIQRQIIWNALVYSYNKYVRHGDVEKAAEVRQVINETIKLFGIAKEYYTSKEVESITEQVKSDAMAYGRKMYRSGFKDGKNVSQNKISNLIMETQKINVCDNPKIQILSGVIDLNKCKECDHRDKCLVFQSIQEVEKLDTKNVAESSKEINASENHDGELSQDSEEKNEDKK